MPDGESQSAITRKLNRLAGRRMRGLWSQTQRASLIADLLNSSMDPGAIAGQALAGTDGVEVTVAPRLHEQAHIRSWPLLHLAVIRETIAFAIDSDNDIQTVYDWEPRPGRPVETSIKISPDLICITFKSPPA